MLVRMLCISSLHEHRTLRIYAAALGHFSQGAWLCRPNIAVARLEVTEGRVVLVNSDRAVSTHRWLSPKDAGRLRLVLSQAMCLHQHTGLTHQISSRQNTITPSCITACPLMLPSPYYRSIERLLAAPYQHSWLQERSPSQCRPRRATAWRQTPTRRASWARPLLSTCTPSTATPFCQAARCVSLACQSSNVA